MQSIPPAKPATNEITIFGGWAAAGKPSNDVWIFNYVDMEWCEVATSGIQPKPRYRHTAEIVGSKMYVLGGSDNGTDEAEDGAEYLGIHQLDLETMQWSHPSIRGENPFPRSGHSSAHIGASSVAIFGGKLNNNVSRCLVVLLYSSIHLTHTAKHARFRSLCNLSTQPQLVSHILPKISFIVCRYR